MGYQDYDKNIAKNYSGSIDKDLINAIKVLSIPGEQPDNKITKEIEKLNNKNRVSFESLLPNLTNSIGQVGINFSNLGIPLLGPGPDNSMIRNHESNIN